MTARPRAVASITVIAVLVVAAAACGELVVAAPDAPAPVLAGPPTGLPPPGVPPGAQQARVVRVTDGDTLRVVATGEGPIPVGQERPVRLLEVDAPERGECGADAATALLESLLPAGADTWLLADREPRDRYDRDLRYLWDGAGLQVQEALVGAGAVWTVLFEPNDLMIERLRRLEEDARAAGRGLWGPPCAREALGRGADLPMKVAGPPPRRLDTRSGRLDAAAQLAARRHRRGRDHRAAGDQGRAALPPARGP